MSGDAISTAAAASARRQVAAISGAVLLLNLVAARAMLSADEVRVYVLGHPIVWECALRRAGLPCPTCGLTRSVVLALGGQLGRAWDIAPGGPMLAGGVLLAALALVASAARREPWPRWMRAGGVVYAAASVLVWLGGWAEQFARAWRAG